MQYRRVGGSGLSVSQLGLGTMGFGSSVDELDAEEQLRVFLDAGGTLVDTAPIYGDGQTEPMLGALLSKLGMRSDVVLSGKAGLAYRDGAVVRVSPAGMGKTLVWNMPVPTHSRSAGSRLVRTISS